MEITKIQLSSDELHLMQSGDWILTKNSVIEKICQGLGHLATKMQQKLEERKHMLTGDVIQSSPKISRGEKYQGLPYVILDYPRKFEKENILAIRTLFWWGYFCSITLHVKGKFLASVLQNMITEIETLRKNNFYISVSGDQWNHNIMSQDYMALKNISMTHLEEELISANFLKLSSRVELSQWNTMERELFVFFISLLKLIES